MLLVANDNCGKKILSTYLPPGRVRSFEIGLLSEFGMHCGDHIKEIVMPATISGRRKRGTSPGDTFSRSALGLQ